MSLSAVLASIPDRINERRAQRGMSWREASVDAGIPHVTLFEIANRRCDPRLSTLLRLIDWLELDPKENP